MKDFWSYFCLGGVCISPLMTFLLGFVIGKNGVPFRLRLERVTDPGHYAVDDEI